MEIIGDRICNRIVNELPENIYLSFDIDGLGPQNYVHIPEPLLQAVLKLNKFCFYSRKLLRAEKKLSLLTSMRLALGPEGNDWDANVAARLLFRIANLTAMSQKLL